MKWDGLDEDSEKFSWWWKKVCTISLNKVNQARIQLLGYSMDVVENQKLMDFQRGDENGKEGSGSCCG